MPYALSAINQFAVAGKAFSAQQSLSAPRLETVEELIPIAWDSTLTTRTSGLLGTLTMTSVSHLVTTGAVIDLYWIDTNGVPQSIHNVVAGTVAGTSVPFTVTADSPFPETALPPLNTEIFVGITQVFNISIVGNNMLFLVAAADIAAALITLIDVTPTENLVIPILPNGAYGWVGQGVNPLAGVTPIHVHMSHADILTPRLVRITAGLSI